jgi:serine/threonine-protein kinase
MLLSVLPHVDQIVLGVDGRSDRETLQVAEAYADISWTFDASDLHLSEEQWLANRIDFAAARNLGRQRVTLPWTLVVDSDEYLRSGCDIREKVATESDVAAFGVRVNVNGFEHADRQRLARTYFRWWSATHNQLNIEGGDKPIQALIVQDTSLRLSQEIERRAQQRDLGIDLLEEEAAAGQLMALFHLAKHRLAQEDHPKAIKLVQDYRFRAEPHGPLVAERTALAFGAAGLFYEKGDFVEAELWAIRAMLDGPSVEAMCLLGDIAEDQGDLERALAWYEAACVVPEAKKLRSQGFSDLRWGRREGLRRGLKYRDEAALIKPDSRFRYTLKDRLATGSRGSEVSSAIQIDADGVERVVVIKRMRDTEATSRRTVVNEILLAKVLSHQNIVEVLDGGDDSDGCFVVSEFVEGPSLSAAIEGGLPLGLGIWVIEELCSALTHVHGVRGSNGSRLRIVHRDVCPQNILIRRVDGLVKLLDFGVARSPLQPETARTVCGHVDFMSPEQARGEDVDARFDVYSVGTALYLMATGRMPYTGASEVETLLRVQRGQPAPLPEDVNPALAAVIYKAMAADSTERFQSADALRMDLAEVRKTHFPQADQDALVRWVAERT